VYVVVNLVGLVKQNKRCNWSSISHCGAKFWSDKLYCWKCWQWAGRMQLQCSRRTAPSQECCVQLKMLSDASAARTARLN